MAPSRLAPSCVSGLLIVFVLLPATAAEQVATCPALDGGDVLRWCRSGDGRAIEVHYAPQEPGGLVVRYSRVSGQLSKTFHGLSVSPKTLEDVPILESDSEPERQRLFRLGVLREMERRVPSPVPAERALAQIAAYFDHFSRTKPHLAERLEVEQWRVISTMLTFLEAAIAAHEVRLAGKDLDTPEGRQEQGDRFDALNSEPLEPLGGTRGLVDVLRARFERRFRTFLDLEDKIFRRETSAIPGPSAAYDKIGSAIARSRPTAPWLADTLEGLLREGRFRRWPEFPGDLLMSCESDPGGRSPAIVIYDPLLEAPGDRWPAVAADYLRKSNADDVRDAANFVDAFGLPALDFAFAHELGHYLAAGDGVDRSVRENWAEILLQHRQKEMIVRMVIATQLDVETLLAEHEAGKGPTNAHPTVLLEILMLWPVVAMSEDGKRFEIVNSEGRGYSLRGPEAKEVLGHLATPFGEPPTRLVDEFVRQTAVSERSSWRFASESMAHAFAIDALMPMALPVSKEDSPPGRGHRGAKRGLAPLLSKIVVLDRLGP